jgi:hypothetical protein
MAFVMIMEWPGVTPSLASPSVARTPASAGGIANR